MNALDTALRWHSLGVATIPVRHRGKRPLVTWSSYQRRLPSEDELQLWFDEHSDPDKPHNLAVVCGWKGLTVIDFDDMDAYLCWRAWAIGVGGIAAEVAEIGHQVLTRRGIHVYTALDDPPAGNLRFDLFDIKAEGGYVLAPPSVHPSGLAYAALDEAAPIIRAASLSDLLPAAFLTSDDPADDVSAGVSVRRCDDLPADPWAAAVSPALNGDGPVREIHDEMQITDLFPDARRSKRHHRQYLWTRCPLHDDHDPSLSIDPRQGRAKCWAGCTEGRWWDSIDWYAAINGLSNGEAIKELAM